MLRRSEYDELTRPLIIDVHPRLHSQSSFGDCASPGPVRMDPFDTRSAGMRVLTNRRMLMHIVAFQPAGVPMATVVAREQRLEHENERRKRYYWSAVFLGVAETACLVTEAWLLLAILMTQRLQRPGLIALLIAFGFTTLTGLLGWIKFNQMGIHAMALQRKRRGKEPNCCWMWMWLLFVPTWLSQQFLSDDTHPLLCLGFFFVAGPVQAAMTIVSEAVMLILFVLRVYISPVTNIIGRWMLFADCSPPVDLALTRSHAHNSQAFGICRGGTILLAAIQTWRSIPWSARCSRPCWRCRLSTSCRSIPSLALCSISPDRS